MPQTSYSTSLSNEEQKKLADIISGLCSDRHPKQDRFYTKELILQITSFYSSHKNKQSLGSWIHAFLLEIIPKIHHLTKPGTSTIMEINNFLLNLPCDESDDSYKSTMDVIKPEDVIPLTPQRYLFLLQMVALLLELKSPKTGRYLEELSSVISDNQNVNIFNLVVRMLAAKLESHSDNCLEEQIKWLELILQACALKDREFLVYLLAQWMLSLNWLRPHSLRKELLLLIYEEKMLTCDYINALVLYELYNMPDKSVATSEKHLYLNKLMEMPASLFTVSQLQDMYYFSGSIKSTGKSSFMESVSDFKNSNYYNHKYWSRVGKINHFFHKHFLASDYLETQSLVNNKIQDLINLINTQSNAFVETLQSNYAKIDELYHTVEELSLRDSLTGLYNRRYLYNNITEMLQLAVRQQTPISFVIFDIDDFKPINDTYGHLAGDSILEEISGLLRNYFRKSDFLVRYGGEEFLIVLFNSDHIQAEMTLDSLRKKILQHNFIYQKKKIQLTISVGITTVYFDNPCITADLEQLISEADAAMYESKVHGKNQITSKVFHY